ncbi:MAG: LacI family DNA-binding transcriptional regulator [Thermoflexales bacterium]|nr:LacI family DNA-binding transcriptional regulator [Thermoflexales bacterium]
MRSRPTIQDVARRAGVSRQTVSRVLNNKGEVRPETRERVLAAIEELNYRPNAVARSMVRGHTCTLGCIAPSLTDFTFASIIEGAQAEARRQGYFILTGSAPTEREVESLLEEFLHRQVDGLMVFNPYADGRFRYLLPLIQNGVPVVYLGNTPRNEPVSSVRCDDRDGGFQATRYLLALGHTTIATIIGPANEECVDDRLDGYRRALEENGLSVDDRLIVQGDWSAISGYRAARSLLETGIPFTAIFAQNDQMAIGAIRALREAGLQVPRDVSVIGFDDIPLASYFDPPLTTLRQPMTELGEHAARLLISAIREPGLTPERRLLPARIVERASCAAR